MIEPATTHILDCGDGLVVAEVGPVCVVVWRDAVTRVRFERQRNGLATVVAHHPAKAGFLCIIEPTCAPPEDELRRASADMIVSYRGRLRCLGTVVEARGFKAAVARSVLGSITLLAGNRGVPLRYFAGVEVAVRWMTEYVAIEPRAFMLGLDFVRARLDTAQAMQVELG
jgi:hypothetical protein